MQSSKLDRSWDWERAVLWSNYLKQNMSKNVKRSILWPSFKHNVHDLDVPSSHIAGIAVPEGQPLPRYGNQLTCWQWKWKRYAAELRTRWALLNSIDLTLHAEWCRHFLKKHVAHPIHSIVLSMFESPVATLPLRSPPIMKSAHLRPWLLKHRSLVMAMEKVHAIAQIHRALQKERGKV